jgi:WD40 repeat protein
MDSSIKKIFNHLRTDSDEKITWSIHLDVFILEVIPVGNSKLAWVVGSEEKVFLVHRETGSVVEKFENLAEFIFTAVIHPRSNKLYLAASSGIFALSTRGAVDVLIEEQDWFEHLAISDDGKVLFSAKGRGLYIFSLSEKNCELISQDQSFSSTISDIIFNVDAFLVSNYGGVREYKTKDFEQYQMFEWKTSLLTTSWSPDKKYIAAGTQENGIHFWPYPFKKGQDFQISGYPTKVHKILWAKQSEELVVNCAEDVHFWDFSEGPPTGKSPTILQCGFGKIKDISYHGNLLVASSDKGFIFYFLPDKSKKCSLIHSVSEAISCITLSQDEKELLGGTKSGTLHSFEVALTEINLNISNEKVSQKIKD